jgi:hypothetical protein
MGRFLSPDNYSQQLSTGDPGNYYLGNRVFSRGGIWLKSGSGLQVYRSCYQRSHSIARGRRHSVVSSLLG